MDGQSQWNLKTDKQEKIHLKSAWNPQKKRNLFETDDGEEFVGKGVSDFMKKNNNKNYSRHTPKRSVFAERLDSTSKKTT